LIDNNTLALKFDRRMLEHGMKVELNEDNLPMIEAVQRTSKDTKLTQVRVDENAMKKRMDDELLLPLARVHKDFFGKRREATRSSSVASVTIELKADEAAE
jgi:hypothetical protein